MKLASVITMEGKYCTKRLTREFALSVSCTRRDERNIMLRETHLPDRAVSSYTHLPCPGCRQHLLLCLHPPPTFAPDNKNQHHVEHEWQTQGWLWIPLDKQVSWKTNLCCLYKPDHCYLCSLPLHTFAFPCSLHQEFPPPPVTSISVLPQSFCLKRFNSPRFLSDSC